MTDREGKKSSTFWRRTCCFVSSANWRRRCGSRDARARSWMPSITDGVSFFSATILALSTSIVAERASAIPLVRQEVLQRGEQKGAELPSLAGRLAEPSLEQLAEEPLGQIARLLAVRAMAAHVRIDREPVGPTQRLEGLARVGIRVVTGGDDERPAGRVEAPPLGVRIGHRPSSILRGRLPQRRFSETRGHSHGPGHSNWRRTHRSEDSAGSGRSAPLLSVP